MIFRLILLVLITVISGLDASHADQIWMAPQKPTKAQSDWYPRPIKLITGKIIDFDAKQIQVLVVGDEVPTRFAAHRVLWIESAVLSAKETKALEQFASGSYSASLRQFIESLQDRPPVWRQQWMSMMAANAAWRGSQAKIALELVSQLDAHPLPPLTISWLPVDWDGKVVDRTKIRSTTEAATARLQDPSSAVRLVAASWLIAAPAREKAKVVLQQLSVDNKRPVIARLAEVVSWRLANTPEITENADVWQAKVDELPMVLQNGPTKLLIDKFARGGLTKRSAKLKLSVELTPVVPILPANSN